MKLQYARRASAAGPLAKFNSRFLACVHGPRVARRWGSRVLPFASLRVPSGARIHGPSPNSLRSLRSLRSNSGDESVHEARGYARGHEFCAPRLRLFAPAAGHPRAWSRSCWAAQKRPTVPARRRAGRGRGDLGAAEKHRAEVGARTRALRELTHRECLSAANEVSEASFAVRPQTEHRRAPVAKRRASLMSPDRAPPAALLAQTVQQATLANSRKGPIAACRGTRPARWSH